LELIERAYSDRSVSIVDVGGGESTLVDDLCKRGFRDITVLDISQTALDVAQARVGNAGRNVRWICADILNFTFPDASFDVWHDRAVFHFLTDPEQRRIYVERMASAVKPNGHVILSTFGPQGPTKCSGLETMRYDAEKLREELGERFQLIENSIENHQTPAGTMQQFLCCDFRRL
jgi:2-polyprenyl-3-methyl-5-hydroxy-6-metoxy-1,4-benzoquinol methylase